MAELQFKLAQLLPDFLKISSELEAKEFRDRFPDFAPKSWWTSPDPYPSYPGSVHVRDGEVQVNGKLQTNWQFAQHTLRKAWGNGFEGNYFTMKEAVESVFDNEGGPLQAFKEPLERIDKAFTDQPAWGYLVKQAFWKDLILRRPVCDYHKAVLYLFQNPWRAKFCLLCRQPFVASAKAARYCDTKQCRAQYSLYRKAAKRETWHKNKKKYQKSRASAE